jgi:hypothetical protein
MTNAEIIIIIIFGTLISFGCWIYFDWYVGKTLDKDNNNKS